MATRRHAHSPLVLVIRDGWGRNPHPEHDAFNAVALARTPGAAHLEQTWPTTLIRTSGEAVGLPDGTMGNSEVGHQNIGAGRVVPQEIMRITNAIRDGSFARNRVLGRAFEHARRTRGSVHLLGLASDGRVHSDLAHLDALIELAARSSFPPERLLVHMITDGRDTAPFSGLGFVDRVEATLARAGVGRVASVIGRYYAMDRDNRWGRVALAYACLTGSPLRHHDTDTAGLEIRTAPSAARAVQTYYDHPLEPSRRGDEFIVPTRIVPEPHAEGRGTVAAGDAVIFFNFRGDRPRELTKGFVLDDAAWADIDRGGFDRGERIRDLFFCTLSLYEEGLPTAVVFDRPSPMGSTLGAVLETRDMTQFRCAETEKFPHVTFFFNDYREAPFAGERRLLIPSPKDVTTYDQKPEMSAAGIRDGVLERLADPRCEPLLVVNFANPDMVGHTGSLEAAITAVETVDGCVGRIVEGTLARGGGAIVTADHGNAEQMWDPVHDTPHTAHTTYDVPLTVIGHDVDGRTLRDGGRLGDIAPTVLEMMGIDQPEAMTGVSLLE